MIRFDGPTVEGAALEWLPIWDGKLCGGGQHYPITGSAAVSGAGMSGAGLNRKISILPTAGWCGSGENYYQMGISCDFAVRAEPDRPQSAVRSS